MIKKTWTKLMIYSKKNIHNTHFPNKSSTYRIYNITFSYLFFYKSVHTHSCAFRLNIFLWKWGSRFETQWPHHDIILYVSFLCFEGCPYNLYLWPIQYLLFQMKSLKTNILLRCPILQKPTSTRLNQIK